jgi:hypothetical protein
MDEPFDTAMLEQLVDNGPTVQYDNDGATLQDWRDFSRGPVWAIMQRLLDETQAYLMGRLKTERDHIEIIRLQGASEVVERVRAWPDQYIRALSEQAVQATAGET